MLNIKIHPKCTELEECIQCLQPLHRDRRTILKRLRGYYIKIDWEFTGNHKGLFEKKDIRYLGRGIGMISCQKMMEEVTTFGLLSGNRLTENNQSKIQQYGTVGSIL